MLFGNMCSGKSSVAQILRNEAGCEVVSAKDVIERNADAAGEDVRRRRQGGFLLPDPLVTEWVFSALDSALATGRPVLLDGFPRTEPQARTVLASPHRPASVVFLDFDLPVLRRRFENRVLCVGCGMPHSLRFSDFEGQCVYCASRGFAPRPTDRPDYFEVKTGQFNAVSMEVVPALEAAGLAFLSLRDHATLAGLRAETLALVGRHGD